MNTLGKLWAWLEGGIYDWFCWYVAGLPQPGEHITDYLVRQKERMGGWFYIMPILTILFTFVLLGLEVWLLVHVIISKVKKGVYMPRRKAPARRSKAVKATRRRL